MDNTLRCNSNKNMFRKVTVNIGLEKIDIQERVTVKALLDSRVIELVIKLEFARKQGFKLKKFEKSIYVRNVNGSFNKKKLIEYIVEVNIYYQRYRKRIEIDVIRNQKQSVILRVLQPAHHNPKINQRTGEVKMTRCPEKCRKQQRPKQGKLG